MGHAQPRLVELARLVVAGQQRHRPVVQHQRDAEGLGDAGRGDVVMRRPDAPGGEDIVVARAGLVDGVDDVGLDIGDDAGLAQADAERRQLLGEEAEIHVLGAAGQDLVADDQDGGRDAGRRLAHGDGGGVIFTPPAGAVEPPRGCVPGLP